VNIRAELERVEDARQSGELTEEECVDWENELLGRLMYRQEWNLTGPVEHCG